MFNEDFRHGKTFKADTSKLPFITLKDYVAQGLPAEFKVIAAYTHNKSQYGEKAIISSEKYNIDMPKHLIKDIKKINGNQMYIDAINDGHCGFRLSTYTDKNGVVRNSGTFFDL